MRSKMAFYTMKICHWNFEMQCNVYCIILMTITILKARLRLCKGNLDYLDQSNRWSQS